MKKGFGVVTGNQWIGVVAILGTAVIVGACGSQQKTILADVPVNITFDQSKCPTGVDPNTPVEVQKANNQRIAWQAVDSSGKNFDLRYRIYFDPFKSRPLRSNSKGYERSPKFYQDTPVGVEYKYTIVADDCKDKPLDPRFRLR